MADDEQYLSFNSKGKETNRKSKSIGAASDMNDEMKDEVESVRSTTKMNRSKSGGAELKEEMKRKKSKAKDIGRKSSSNISTDDVERGKIKYADVIYLFVARDSDMFVFECHYDMQVKPAKFKAEIFELLNYFQEQISEEKERPPTHVKPLIFDKLQLHLHYDQIYYGLIAPE